MTTITLQALLEVLLEMQGTFVLCNAHGSLAFKDQELYLGSYQEWLTVFHATPKNPESQRHLHLKWHTFHHGLTASVRGSFHRRFALAERHLLQECGGVSHPESDHRRGNHQRPHDGRGAGDPGASPATAWAEGERSE
jgi:hypothetical protein